MPNWISTAMAIIFALQWTFTMLPHSLMIRSICYAIGAFFGFYIIGKNYQLLFQKNAAPIWLMFLLFAWMIFHLLFIGRNHDLQIAEYSSIWKRAFLGAIFAIGFGISLIQSNQSRNWNIVVIGLCAPTIIYFIKLTSTYLLPVFGYEAPIYLRLFYSSAEFYVPKIAYVFFCLPLLAVSFGMLSCKIRGERFVSPIHAWYWVAAIISVMIIFIIDNIKNGVIYSLLLAVIFFFSILKNIYKFSILHLRVILSIIFSVTILASLSYRNNSSWESFAADFEVGYQISPEVIWEMPAPIHPANQPKNKYNEFVSATNFERAFYAATGLNLLKDNLLGYGLVQSSFGHLARERWPNAPLIQTHSGWIDLLLGLGVPGALLLFAASALAILNISQCLLPWKAFGAWSLGSILLMYITTEVAQKNYLETYIWFVVLVSSLSLRPYSKIEKIPL